MGTTAEKKSLDSLDPTSAMLLLEHVRVAGLYQHNIDFGDRYVTTYLTVMSVAIALLVGFRELGASSNFFVLVELALLMIVLVIGVITFSRLVERRIHGIEYLRAINRIHRFFVNKDSNVGQYLYWPAHDDCPSVHTKATAMGALHDLVAALNSLFLGFAVTIMVKISSATFDLPVAAFIGIIVGVLVWFLQRRYSTYVLRCAEQEMDQHTLFPQPRQVSQHNQQP